MFCELDPAFGLPFALPEYPYDALYRLQTDDPPRISDGAKKALPTDPTIPLRLLYNIPFFGLGKLRGAAGTRLRRKSVALLKGVDDLSNGTVGGSEATCDFRLT